MKVMISNCGEGEEEEVTPKGSDTGEPSISRTDVAGWIQFRDEENILKEAIGTRWYQGTKATTYELG